MYLLYEIVVYFMCSKYCQFDIVELIDFYMVGV